MLKCGKSLLIIVFLIGIVLYATVFSNTFSSLVGKYMPASGKKVLGISIDPKEKNNLTNEIKKEANSSAKTAEKQIMQVKIGDIIQVFSRGQKIVKDASSLSSSIQNALKKGSK